MNWNQLDRAPRRGLSRRVARLCLLEQDIPRLSKAGMPSRSEGWGGLFKDEQYRLIRSASRVSIRWLRVFEQTTPALRAFPSLLRRGICFPSTESAKQHALYARVLMRVAPTCLCAPEPQESVR
jgi:hypothetical protein